MSALSTQPYKGARDFYPEDKRIQNYIFSTWQKSVEGFGYEQYDAPLLESLDLYAAKSGQEIVNEQTYTFTDRGGRQIAIRPEMTPTVSRMVAQQRQELPYPLRWYSIPNLWRYERPQRGRLREHWQLNVDLFGVGTIDAELEIILIADAIMKNFGATHKMYQIKINSRLLVNEMMGEYLGLDVIQSQLMIKLFDRKDKISHEEFSQQAADIFDENQRITGLQKIAKLLNVHSLAELPKELLETKALQEVQTLFSLLHDHGVTNATFDITLMRGFDYYTDIVFEVFDSSPENNRSIFGGGRYDGLVGLFGVEPVPTIGFGMGDVVIRDFLIGHDLLPHLRPATEVYVIVLGDVMKHVQSLVKQMREENVNVAVDITNRKIDKQIKTAIKQQIPYILFIGQEEIDEELFTLKNTHTEDEEKMSLERIITTVKDYRYEDE